MRTTILLLTVLATAAIGQAAMACGDSLYRVGKGTPYRTYTTPLPGQLLVYADNAHAEALAQGLADSGHEVFVAVTIEALQEALEHGDFDVVLAPFEQRDVVTASANTKTEYLPVIADREERRVAAETYDRVLDSDGNIKRYLKTIHKTLKSRA